MNKKKLVLRISLIVLLVGGVIYLACKPLTFRKHVVLRNTVGTLTVTTQDRSLAKARVDYWKIEPFPGDSNDEVDMSLCERFADMLDFDDNRYSVEYYALYIPFDVAPRGGGYTIDNRYASKPLHIKLDFEDPIISTWSGEEDISIIGLYSESMESFEKHEWYKIENRKRTPQTIEFDFEERDGVYRYPAEVIMIAIVTDHEFSENIEK